MTAATPAPRTPGPATSRGRARRRSGRVRWGRIPGRIILALCFVLGALALGAVTIPFTTTTEAGTDLRCGPAVFEVLMPTDPAFDDTPENTGCAEPARTRLLIAGGVVVGVLLVAAIAERRTRRGSVRRDTEWLATSPSRAARRSRRDPAVGSGPARASTAISSGSGRDRPPNR